jgi:hypothetical protein
VRVVRDGARLLRDLFRMRHWAATGEYEADVAGTPDLPAAEPEDAGGGADDEAGVGIEPEGRADLLA